MAHPIPDVAVWRSGIQTHAVDDDEPRLASHLFEALVAAFSALLRTLALDPEHVDSSTYELLRGKFSKFYMWNEGFSTRAGDLDHTLASSKNLEAAVLGSMVHWVKAVSKVPKIMPEYDWSNAMSKFDELEVITHKADQVSKAASADMKSRYAVINDIASDHGSDLDLEYDTESSVSDDTFEDIAADLNAYMESLTDLSPCLEHPATDSIALEDSPTRLLYDLSAVHEPARPFVLIIQERFPSLDPRIVRKLGEANWQRRQRLHEKLIAAPESESSSTDDGRSSDEDTIVNNGRRFGQDGGTVGSTVRSSLSAPTYHQSITTASGISEPSIFDNPTYSPNPRRFRTAPSVTSFATSIADGLDLGHRRIPNLPGDYDYASPFACQFCGDILTNVQNRADWKTHVFNDVEPYVCLFADCPLGLHTFKSRREWMEHEFNLHRVAIQWRCNLCKEVHESTDSFRSHIFSLHSDTIASSQVEEVISASKRLIPCDVRLEQCPFCLTSPSQTQKGFASHVGKHQQEISLAALPRFEEISDADSSDDDNDDNGDDNDASSSSSTIEGASNDVSTRSDDGLPEAHIPKAEASDADKRSAQDESISGGSDHLLEHAINSQTAALLHNPTRTKEEELVNDLNLLPTGTKVLYVRALYDFDASDSSELSLQKGDFVRVVQQLATGWWDGYRWDGYLVEREPDRGWFPSNHCEIIKYDEIEDDRKEAYDDNEEAQDSEETNDTKQKDSTSKIEISPRDKTAADIWIPQATRNGRLFYLNTETGESSMELPSEQSSSRADDRFTPPSPLKSLVQTMDNKDADIEASLGLRNSGTKPSDPRPRIVGDKSAGPSRSSLNKALAAAKEAVRLDDAQNLAGAIGSYSECCMLLQIMIVNASDLKDKRKLEGIRNMYNSRMNELKKFTLPTHDKDGKAVRGKPDSQTYRADNAEPRLGWWGYSRNTELKDITDARFSLSRTSEFLMDPTKVDNEETGNDGSKPLNESSASYSAQVPKSQEPLGAKQSTTSSPDWPLTSAPSPSNSSFPAPPALQTPQKDIKPLPNIPLARPEKPAKKPTPLSRIFTRRRAKNAPDAPATSEENTDGENSSLRQKISAPLNPQSSTMFEDDGRFRNPIRSFNVIDPSIVERVNKE